MKHNELSDPCLVLIWKKRKGFWECLYRMLVPIEPGLDIRGKLLKWKMGSTKVTPPMDDWTPECHPDIDMTLNTPFRDGCHIRWDSVRLKLPAYVIWGKKIERVIVRK